MGRENFDLISSLNSDDVVAIKECLAALPDVDFKYNNKTGGSSLTLAWIAAFVGARKCLAEAVRRGADIEFFANGSTVRSLGLLKQETLFGLLEGGISPNQKELTILFLSEFENELPKAETIQTLDAIIREIGDLDASDPDALTVRICNSTAFSDLVPNMAEELRKLERMTGPDAKQLKDSITATLVDTATMMSQEILRSLSLIIDNVAVFDEIVKRHFRGYRKSRAWLNAAALRARADLQSRLGPMMGLYEDDENLINWIDLALSRYPIREVIIGSEASFVPRRNDGLEFEKAAAQSLEEAGFHVEVTPSSGDQGADVIAMRNGLRFAIQCKDYVGQVGNAAVQEVLAAKAFYKTDYAVVCSNAGYTKSAKTLAATSSVLLITPELLPDLEKIRLLVE